MQPTSDDLGPIILPKDNGKWFIVLRHGDAETTLGNPKGYWTYHEAADALVETVHAKSIPPTQTASVEDEV